MLSKIKAAFGSIFTYLKNWGARPANATYWVPYATIGIILTNVFVHFHGAGWGFTLADLLRQPFALIGYQFTHPTFEHLFGNMLFLFLFGPSVERYFGHLKFIAFYLLCGIGAALGFALFFPLATVVGASGAIAGLIAIHPFVHRSIVVRLMSACLVAVYFYSQVQASIQDLMVPELSLVAHLAHVVGGVTALVVFSYLHKKS